MNFVAGLLSRRDAHCGRKSRGLIQRAQRVQDGGQNNHHHNQHINPQSPENHSHARGEFRRPKARLVLGGDDLIRLKQGQHNLWVLQVGPPELTARRLGPPSGRFPLLCFRFHPSPRRFRFPAPLNPAPSFGRIYPPSNFGKTVASPNPSPARIKRTVTLTPARF